MPEDLLTQELTLLLENALTYISNADRLLQRAVSRIEIEKLSDASVRRSYAHALNSLDRLESIRSSLCGVSGDLESRFELID